MAPISRRTGFVEHDGEHLYFEVAGKGGTPLVLSHGAGGNHAVWFQQVSRFAADRMVVTWDHRGFGLSTDRAGRSGPEVAGGDLLAVLDHLGVHGAHLVGQSMGGWTVVGAALARPALPRSVVLADTLGGFTSDAVMAALEKRGGPGRTPPGRLGYHPALGLRFSAEQPALAHLYQSLGAMGTADPEVVIGRLLSTTHTPLEATRLDVPVLLVVGGSDPLFPPASVRALAALLPDASVVEIPGCGHSPYFEDPRSWNDAVGRFLRTHDLEPPARSL